MSGKGFSSTKFWFTQLSLVALLIAVAGVIIFLRQASKSQPKPEGAPEKPSVASGLSNFYREFRLSSSELIKEPTGDFTLDIARDDTPLDTRLQNMSSELKPVNGRWVGEHKYRTFEAGSTLRTAISNFAQQEGMQVIWDLNEDFVVKHQFQTNDSIVGSVADVASSIDSNFNGEVKAYFCPKQRTIVLTTQKSEFIVEECNLAR